MWIFSLLTFQWIPFRSCKMHMCVVFSFPLQCSAINPHNNAIISSAFHISYFSSVRFFFFSSLLAFAWLPSVSIFTGFTGFSTWFHLEFGICSIFVLPWYLPSSIIRNANVLNESRQNLPKNVEWRMLEFTYAPHHTTPRHAIPSSYKNTFCAYKYYVDKLEQMILIFIVAEIVSLLPEILRMKRHLFKWNMEQPSVEYWTPNIEWNCLK